MTTDAYKAALQKAMADLINAIQQRDHWVMEIARLQPLVKSLADAATKQTKNAELIEILSGQIALTDIVQSIVGRSFGQMSPVDVRDAIVSSGYDLSKYSNPQAMVHQTLKRLAEKGIIHETEDGRYHSGLMEALKGLNEPATVGDFIETSLKHKPVNPPPGVKRK